ncbi:hypothetical protein ACWCPT_05855 [Streptomyces sp. NPDC002308]
MTDTIEQHLLHLAARARDGVALDAEHDALAAGIAALAEECRRTEAARVRADRVARTAARQTVHALDAQLAAQDTLDRVHRLLDKGPIGTCCDRYLRAALGETPANGLTALSEADGRMEPQVPISEGPVMTNRTAQDEAQNAILTKIKEAAESIDQSRGPQYASAVLKDLAEAYAWATYPGQPH